MFSWELFFQIFRANICKRTYENQHLNVVKSQIQVLPSLNRYNNYFFFTQKQ